MGLLAATALALCSSLPSSQVGVAELTLGTPADASFRYWAIEDTYIDSAAPDQNNGRDALLSGGPGRTILIRFGDLNRLLPIGAKVTSASLKLGEEVGGTYTLERAFRMLVGWGEGPGRRGLQLGPNKPDPTKKPVFPWAATWKHRRSGTGAIGWSSPGGVGAADAVAIEAATAQVAQGECVISGLAQAVQAMVDDPTRNFGFGLRFSSAVDFASSDSPGRRPTLVIRFEYAPRKSGTDLAVTSITAAPFGAGGWPQDGAEVVWRGVVKNVGAMPVSGFRSSWTVNDRGGAAVQVSKPLEPGQSATVEFRSPFVRDHSNHRLHPISLQVEAEQPDVDPTNNELTSFQSAIPIEAVILATDRAAIEAACVSRGFKDAEHWLQAMLSLWNELIAPHSRFSFAPEGCLETVRLQSVSPTASVSNGVLMSWSINPSWFEGPSTSRLAMRSLALLLGAPNCGANVFPLGGARASIGGSTVERAILDPFPGLTGGGDTRDHGLLPTLLAMPYDPWADPNTEFIAMPSTDLMAGAEVAAINANLGRIGADRLGRVYDVPGAIFLRALDLGGRPIPDTELELYIAGGTDPIAKLKTTNKGAAMLPNRPAPLGGVANPFGALDSSLATGLIGINATKFGVTEWTWVKAWQLMDARARGNVASAFFDVRLNLPRGPIGQQNLALNRLVSDSRGSLPAQLAALVDGSSETSVTVAASDGDWIEIDLGRDRPIGEVRIDVEGTSIWPSFEIRVYDTGQSAAEARLYGKEIAGWYALQTRSDPVAGNADLRSLAYRGAAMRGRFVRLLFQGKSDPVKLGEFRVALLEEG